MDELAGREAEFEPLKYETLFWSVGFVEPETGLKYRIKNNRDINKFFFFNSQKNNINSNNHS